jgi:hypothetical protein
VPKSRGNVTNSKRKTPACIKNLKLCFFLRDTHSPAVSCFPLRLCCWYTGTESSTKMNMATVRLGVTVLFKQTVSILTCSKTTTLQPRHTAHKTENTRAYTEFENVSIHKVSKILQPVNINGTDGRGSISGRERDMICSTSKLNLGPNRPYFQWVQEGCTSRNSSVGIALGYGLEDRGSKVRFPAGAVNFSLHHRVQNGSGAHPASYPMVTGGSFPGGKAAGA